jgi:hypothetical protein
MSGSTTPETGGVEQDRDVVPPKPEDVPGADLAEEKGTSEPDGLPPGEI